MRPLRLAALAWLTLAVPAAAQTAGPVTGLLAIGTFPAGTDMGAVRAILPEEVRETAQLYLDGKIGQWFSLADRPGVVFILTGTDPDAARAALEALPLGRAHLMHFDLMPLAPLAPLRLLSRSGRLRDGSSGLQRPAPGGAADAQ